MYITMHVTDRVSRIIEHCCLLRTKMCFLLYKSILLLYFEHVAFADVVFDQM